ncbi:lycopene cyclase domain-containing protein [Halospeciosus flavus]|uniref:Lycopene cyclase domain-containing protein n=1 Tax=Halospeciosus flavus TaxID=3032283 RepID=A0ABD5Z6J8_9EURY
MALARHGRGVRRTAAAFASQVHPVFMLPPVAVSWFGAALAGEFALGVAAVHSLAVFFAVYTAHVRDGYVDFHVRGEDGDHPLTALGCRVALVAATTGFAACLLALFVLAGPLATLLTAPCWVVGYLHAPHLDTNPVTTTLGYPFGIALSLAGGYVAQTGALAGRTVALAAVFLVALSGVKIVDDAQDYDYDRTIDKRTVAVVLGLGRARRVGFGLVVGGLVLVAVLAAVRVFPTGAILAVFAFGAVAAVARRADPELATMLLVRGAYLFLAGLVVAVWYRPLQSPPPVDITVLGPYTYLATELVFGAIALALLVRADALRAAAGTVATLYPVAYLWDWYTLEVGVFAIPMRTGVEVLGIPLEEHLFMVVVPALVVGVHETRRRA